MKEVIPTKEFYQSFKVYAPEERCKSCNQKILSKRPDVKFFLVGITKKGLWKVRFSNKKTISSFHPKFFKEIFHA